MGADPRGAVPADAPHRSFLAYRDYFYLRLAAGLCAACVLAYGIYDPLHGHSGSTWLGYALGTLGAALIGWLAWFGVRKRSYAGGGGLAQAWVSAHVYLGAALLVVATLHTGFQFGWNVHTLAYGLLVLVVLSGLYGVLAYGLLPARITANRRDMPPDAMLAEIRRLDEAALRLAERIDPETQQVVANSITRVRIGGNVWQQLSGRYRALRLELGVLGDFLGRKQGEVAQARVAEQAAMSQSSTQQQTMMFMADQMFDSRRHSRSDELQRLLGTIAQRKALVQRLNRDITLRARQDFWLFLHVPLTVGLLAALAVHVVTVFLYW